MKRVEIKVTDVTKKEGELGDSVQVLIESKRENGEWNRDRVIDAPSGAPEVTTAYVIRNDQRLVIASVGAVEDMVYDREQGASIRPSTQESSIGADKPKPEFTKEEKEKIEQSEARTRVETVLADPVAIEKEGLSESDEPVSSSTIADSDSVKKLEEEAAKKRAEEEEKAAAEKGKTTPQTPAPMAQRNAATTTPQQLTRAPGTQNPPRVQTPSAPSNPQRNPPPAAPSGSSSSSSDGMTSTNEMEKK